MSVDPKLDAAVALLADALPPRARVVVATVTARARPHGEMRIHLVVEARGKPATKIPLRLVLAASHRALDDKTVHVIGRDDQRSRARPPESPADVNFIDLRTRSVSIVAPGIVIARDRVPRRVVRSHGARAPKTDPFADRTSLILRVLLKPFLEGKETRSWGVRELAAEAGVNRTTTSEVLRRLEEWQLVRTERIGTSVSARLMHPVGLIERWSSTYDWTANARLGVHAQVGDPRRFLKRLHHQLADARWAVTLQAAASLLAPHASWNRVHVYVDVPDIEALHELDIVRKSGVGEDGMLVLMKPHYRTSLWQDVTARSGIPVVGIVQLILDLWRYPLRGREQAEHLLDMRSRSRIPHDELPR